MGKAYNSARYSVVDSKTGEVVGSMDAPPAKKQVKERYLKVFYGNPMFRSDMPHATRSLLFALATYMPYSNSGFPLQLSTSAKEKISKAFGISLASIDKGLPYLLENGYLYRVGKGEYLINPHLFGKGPTGAILERQAEWDLLVGENGAPPSSGSEEPPEQR